MTEYSQEVLEYFLEHQDQLFDEPVAETIEEAEEFLSDCMAVVLGSLDEVREYLDGEGMDVADMSDEELADAAEVFALPDGNYLVVEG
ncbi:MAG: glyoxalase [bacterium]